jgi:VWFA-related protein
VYIILLDDLHTNVTRTNNVREVAKKFVDEYLGVDDLAAVVYTSGRQESGQELTGSRRLLKAAIDRFQGQKLPSAGAEKLAVHLRQVSDQTALADEPQESRTSEGLQQARSIQDPFDMERALNARRSLQAIENIAKWLGDVQGRRKALLFFSEGFDYDIYQPFDIGREGSSIIAEAKEAAAAAQRANVNVYGIDPRGMSQFGEMMQINARSDYPQLDYGTFRGQLRELLLAQESLISLSDETGGLPIVNSGDLAGGLARIVLDNSRYYQLAYYSDSAKWSRNRFMKIEVRVKRPGLQVRARKGFLPPDTRAIERAREADVKAGTTPALKAALGKPVPIGDLPLRVFAAPMRAAGGKGGSVLVALEIDGPSLKFEPRDGRFAESIEVSIVAADERARVQGGDRQTFNLNLVPETHERVSRTGVRMLSHLELPPGRYQIRVGAHESTGRAIGTVPYDLEVPDYTKTPFALSGVLLTSTSAAAFATANPETDWNGLLPAPPIVSRTFRSADTLAWFSEVYDNAGQAHTINYSSTLIDARDGRTLAQARDSRMVGADSKGLAQGFSTSLPLRDFAPGTYVLRVEAASTVGGQSARRDVLFEVK